MHSINDKPAPDVKDRLDTLVDALPFNEQIPRRSGEVAFDQAWEIRAFSITTALHAEGNFDWDEFQSRLIEAIKTWENGRTTVSSWNYYERWMSALEDLMRAKGLITDDELDQRTEQFLATPANANHQHAVREPIAVSTPSTAKPGGEPR